MPAPGDLLADRYRILAPIGSGGMATVHRGRDERLQRDVAVKVLLPNLASDPATAQRFEREARAMAAVAHPGLVAVFDVDPGDPASGREPFVVMELCPGGSLADRMAGDHALPPDELIPILVAVADALGALHHAGLVHRDVKPSNILFATDRVKLADFGLVRGRRDGDATELTEPGTAVGTLAYLAPERLGGDPGGPPADVFALATIAHLGLTGSLPRPAGSVRDIVAAAPFRPPAASEVAPALGHAFDEAVLEGLAVDPQRRPDAVTFGSRLATALGAWSRSGRPWTVPAPAASTDEATTALAIPLDATAAYQPVGPPAVAERSIAAPRSRHGSGLPRWPIALVVALAAAIGAVAFLLGSALGPQTAVPSPARTAPRATASTTLPSPVSSPSSSPPATLAATPTADPAIAAVTAAEGAIEAARGGRDGLKGKEANELLAAAQRVEAALENGDRAAALRAARDLARRVDDLPKGLRREAATAIRSAVADLVAALDG